MNAETPLVQQIRLEVGRLGARLFRNNVGALKDETGRWVHYGLYPGSSDLIGWRSITITPEMVGRRAAIFLAIEVKAPGARTKQQRLAKQQNFIDAVRAAGGLAGLADSIEQALRISNGA